MGLHVLMKGLFEVYGVVYWFGEEAFLGGCLLNIDTSDSDSGNV